MIPVVVTGLGLVTPLGRTLGASWEQLLLGTSGIGTVTRFDASWLPVQIAAEIPGYAGYPAELLASTCVWDAVQQGIADAGLTEAVAARNFSMDWILGTTRGELYGFEQQCYANWRQGTGFTPAQFRGFLQANVSYELLDDLGDRLGFQGQRTLVSNACASGAYAIALGADQIRLGRAERVLCAAVDVLSESYYAGFCGLRSLAPDACRPFDRERRGLVIGEAAAAIVLESEVAARRRGARVWATLAGTGWSCDAHHLAIPHPEGQGTMLALRRALAEAGMAAEAVAGVIAHGTGTWGNDPVEARAICRVLGKPPVTAPKSMLGHSMGAASAVEAVIAVLALEHGLLPPTISHTQTDPECPVDCVTAPRPLNGKAVLTNASGFGGNNACLIFTQESRRDG